MFHSGRRLFCASSPLSLDQVTSAVYLKTQQTAVQQRTVESFWLGNKVLLVGHPTYRADSLLSIQ